MVRVAARCAARSLSKYSDAVELSKHFPAIFGPKPLSTQKSLRSAFAQFLRKNSQNALFVTINPHFSRQGGNRAVASTNAGYDLRDVEGAWRFLGRSFYRLDSLYMNCRSAKFLSPANRFQGFVVLEKAWTDPHFHILLTFEQRYQQLLAYWFLLGTLDNVPAVRWGGPTVKDVLNEEEAWTLFRERGWLAASNLSRTTSCLTDLAPATTAKVLLIESSRSLKRVTWYMTKELSGITSANLTAGRLPDSYCDKFDFRELKRFHSPMGIINPARRWTRDPNNPRALLLDLDHMDRWRCKDGTRLY